LTALCAGVVELSAHRRDEYLQAARIGIDPERVEIELDMTPGIAVAEAILGDIDVNRDGSVSADEQRAYAALVLGALEVEVDGKPVTLDPGTSSFPGADEIRRGEGIIRMRSVADLAHLSAGVHQLSFRNIHQRSRSVYLANALAPQSSRVTVTSQRRDPDQTELTIDYVVRAGPERATAAWLLGALGAAAALSALLLRPVQG